MDKDIAEGAGHPAGPRALRLQAAVLARSRARAAAGRRGPGDADREARVEVLGDRIEMLEFTLNDYVDKLDGLVAHSARLSLDRLEPVVDRLERAVAGRVYDTKADAEGPIHATPADPETIADRLSAIEMQVAAISKQLNAAEKPQVALRGTVSRLLAALASLGRRHDKSFERLAERLSAIETLLAGTDRRSRTGSDSPEATGGGPAQDDPPGPFVQGDAVSSAASPSAGPAGSCDGVVLERIEASVAALRQDLSGIRSGAVDSRRAQAMGKALAELLADARRRAATPPSAEKSREC